MSLRPPRVPMSVLCGQHVTKCGIQTAWCGQHSHLHSFQIILSKFWSVLKCGSFSRNKKTFFPKSIENGKYLYHILGGDGSDPVIKNTFFQPSLSSQSILVIQSKLNSQSNSIYDWILVSQAISLSLDFKKSLILLKCC